MNRAITCLVCKGVFALVCWNDVVCAAEPSAAVATLREFDTRVLDANDADARQVVRRDAQQRLREANRRETANWRQLTSRAQWESYRDQRIAALRRSLGTLPMPGEKVESRVTNRIEGDGFVIENLLFESRRDIVVAANLYRPARPMDSMPGILIVHSHHAPKTQGESQTMGMTWARQGALVLVMDQLGHGERRTHVFATAGSFPGSYRPERQDYYFRYNNGMQLQLVGECLIGWMVGDMIRGVDLLLQQPGVDSKRIVVLGAVAGGGDPAGVLAALDARIAAVAPFNFGGYEPEVVYPLPEDAEETFNYSGSGSWESTRNLRLSARDGFMPWLIIGSIAPRHLVYAHEFRWDRPRDPVWKRLQQIFAWHDASDRLAFALGHGTVKQSSTEASHCTNIGAIHRAQLYPLFEKWLAMPPPAQELTDRRTTEELRCNVGAVVQKPLHQVIVEFAADKGTSARQSRAAMKPADRIQYDKQLLGSLLGDFEADANIAAAATTVVTSGSIEVERVRLQRQTGDVVIPLPLLIVRDRERSESKPTRVVVGVAQAGKAEFLNQRAQAIAQLAAAGAWIVLPDLRGTGETMPEGEGRGRSSGSTGRSSTEWMLGQTVLGQRVGDLRSILGYLRSRVPGARFSLWGEGFVAANAADATLAAPLDAEKLPRHCEPLGATACLLAALWESDVDAVYAAGGLVSYRSMLASPYACYVPHDALIPGVLEQFDLLEAVLPGLAPRRVCLADARDGGNQPALDELSNVIEPVRRLYASANHVDRMKIVATPLPEVEIVRWLLPESGTEN